MSGQPPTVAEERTFSEVADGPIGDVWRSLVADHVGRKDRGEPALCHSGRR